VVEKMKRGTPRGVEFIELPKKAQRSPAIVGPTRWNSGRTPDGQQMREQKSVAVRARFNEASGIKETLGPFSCRRQRQAYNLK